MPEEGAAGSGGGGAVWFNISQPAASELPRGDTSLTESGVALVSYRRRSAEDVEGVSVFLFDQLNN